MDHAEKARALFLEGYNCAQAVLCAFDDLTGLDRETSARLASSWEFSADTRIPGIGKPRQSIIIWCRNLPGGSAK